MARAVVFTFQFTDLSPHYGQFWSILATRVEQEISMGKRQMTEFGRYSEQTMLGPLTAPEMIPNWVGLGD